MQSKDPGGPTTTPLGSLEPQLGRMGPEQSLFGYLSVKPATSSLPIHLDPAGTGFTPLNLSFDKSR